MDGGEHMSVSCLDAALVYRMMCHSSPKPVNSLYTIICIVRGIMIELVACWEFLGEVTANCSFPIDKTTLPQVKRELNWEKVPVPRSNFFFLEQSRNAQREKREPELWLATFLQDLSLVCFAKHRIFSSILTSGSHD